MKYYIINAFCDNNLSGNPAGVCLCDKTITEQTMQNIARTNNLPETAFIIKNNNTFNLKWFTPLSEIDLYGHATLASAFVIFNYTDYKSTCINFNTKCGTISFCKNNYLYRMLLPIKAPEKILVTNEIKELSGLVPCECYSQRDLILVLENENQVKNYIPDYAKLEKLDKWLGIVITAKGNKCDFVSRYFCPELKAEDPVTGSSHSSLVPLWNIKLHKNIMEAKQLSLQGGSLHCVLCNNGVEISGKAKLYLKGEIYI